MRRITTWLLATLAGLVLLFSYHTSTDPNASATASQGTSVHMVSGASFTSAAYEQSLQSALDRAHL
ncbi:hypothetical protein KW076_06150 [Micrococcus porci]|uniref:hypothetical protein n=1 Tax=Micrococcus porci TaxID=2856555 RepID=UPI001CCD1D06|nr:hypothetical protein [Micrococcus porci]UBH25747.1 hypothetical protein KW076_06150 [Micrococcus porci]